MKGFAGKVLHVDLSKSEARVSSVGRDVFEEFIGGFGLCIKLISDAIPPGATPFSPENPIVIGAGPLVGTNVPAASRLYAFTKLPANNALGWGGAGGVTFACNLRFAGYDAVVITGKAENPSVVRIEDSDVEICDAGHLWGYGIKETCERIWEDFGYGGVVAIGPAGENLIRFSMAFVDRLSTMGRGGIGAVFGSKNLKAVFVRGTGEVEVADTKRYEELCNKLLEEMKNYPHTKEWQELGLLKSLPILPRDVYLKLRKRRIACVSCPIGDKDVIELDGEEIFSTSAVNLLSPLIMGLGDYRKAMKLIASLDDYGIDMFEFFGVLEYARELVDVGKLHLDAEIDLSSFDSMLSWARRIAYREGSGNLLADGFARLEEIGPKPRSVVKGMRAYVTPRGPLVWNLFGTMELGQIVDPRGPHVAAGGSPTYFAKRPPESFRRHLRRMGLEEAKINEILSNGIRIGKLLCYSHIWFTILASLGVCARAQINRFYSAELCAELYSAVTGIAMTKEKLMEKAKKVWRTLKLLNLKEGFSREADSPPDDWFMDGFLDYVTGKPLRKEDVERMVEEYYEEMGIEEVM